MTEIELAKICYALIKIFGKKEGKKLFCKILKNQTNCKDTKKQANK